MSVRRVRTQTCINPQTQAAAELPPNFRDRLATESMSEVSVPLLGGYGEKQKLRDSIREIFFNLSQGRRDIMTDVATQPSDWFFRVQSFNYEKWLNQLRPVELSFSAQVTQVLRTSEPHQTLHHKNISFMVQNPER